MNDVEREREWDARLTAMGDQLDARNRERKGDLFEDYLTGRDCDEASNEPLRVWEENGVWCAVLVGPVGALCGYARLPDGHPWIGLHPEDDVGGELDLEQPAEQAMDDHGVIPIFVAALGGDEGIEEYSRSLAGRIPVHGGLTWAGPMPIKGAPHGWWLGFDCGHAGDSIDERRWREQHPWADERQVGLFCREGHVWSEEEVALEVKRMVPPILEAAGGEERHS